MKITEQDIERGFREVLSDSEWYGDIFQMKEIWKSAINWMIEKLNESEEGIGGFPKPDNSKGEA